MVAHAIRANSKAHGARPFEPARDLTAVARLLEEAFRSEHTFPLSNMPILREVGIALWTMSYAPIFPENVSGFVWVEDGRIVGNVTISQDEGRLDRYLVSNVAVKPNYRRQGIARALMQLAIDHLRGRGADWVLLNVRPNNPGAIQLYQDLNFQLVEMRGEWAFPSSLADALGQGANGGEVATLPGIRPLGFSDRHAVSELIRSEMPRPIPQFRSPRLAEFDPNWEELFTELISDFFAGQVTHRWVLERDRRLVAVMLIKGQRFLTPHRIAVHVHPDYRGRIENDLLEFALHDLARLPQRGIRASVTSMHPEWIVALEQRGFAYANGLTLMALGLG